MTPASAPCRTLRREPHQKSLLLGRRPREQVAQHFHSAARGAWTLDMSEEREAPIDLADGERAAAAAASRAAGSSAE